MKKTINEVVVNEIIVDKSRFIAYLINVTSLDEFNKFLDNLKKNNPKARHFCYAYIINNNKKGSDDGEPKGSAGMPLLTSLEKNSLTNVGVIVIRYFGGILLGSGRLLRTYVKAFEEVFKKATLIELVPKKEVSIELDYDIYDTFKNYLKVNHFNVVNTSFSDKIVITFIVDLDFNFEELNDKYLLKLKLIDIKDYLERNEING